ncbi:hypothetical protein BDR22DRAFT_824663 [Usnea florida]
MTSNLEVLDECTRILRKTIPISDGTEEAMILQKILDELRCDIQYIRNKLSSVGRSIDRLQIEVESQNNLQSRNSLVVTILAAIYVPLAFVTSFLGMNVTPGSVPHWLNVSFYDNYNNSNGSSDSAISNNATTTINGSTQGNSTPQLWDLRWFALLSGPLLFGTIILPLITGPTIRYLCQSYVKLRVYWRLAFVLLATVSLVTSLILNLDDQYTGFLTDLPIPFGFAVWVAFIVLRMISSRREGLLENAQHQDEFLDMIQDRDLAT